MQTMDINYTKIGFTTTLSHHGAFKLGGRTVRCLPFLGLGSCRPESGYIASSDIFRFPGNNRITFSHTLPITSAYGFWLCWEQDILWHHNSEPFMIDNKCVEQMTFSSLGISINMGSDSPWWYWIILNSVADCDDHSHSYDYLHYLNC